MSTARNRLHRRHRFPREIIGYAVRLYFRFQRGFIDSLIDRAMNACHVFNVTTIGIGLRPNVAASSHESPPLLDVGFFGFNWD
jgi:hypothetical protein